MKKRVGVIFGGNSVEHEVSIISAIQAINNIDKEKYDIVPIYISKDKKWWTGNDLLEIKNYNDIDLLLQKCKLVTLCNINDEFCLLKVNGIINKCVHKIDIAFPIVHGKNVEDGSLVGLFETIGIPYVGSGIIGSALGQDKVIVKQLLENNNIPVVKYVWFYDKEYLNDTKKIKEEIKEIGYPVVVKPACLGSSVGINYVEKESLIEDAIEEAILYDRKIIVEKAVENLIEVNCSVIGDYENQEASSIEQVRSSHDILTYNDKYLGSGKNKCSNKGMVNTDRIIPAKIDEKLIKQVSEFSKSTFKVLNLSGVCRIDFLINEKTNEVYVNEPNIIPGSLSFYLWKATGLKYKDLLTKLIELGINDYKNKIKKINSFDTSLLKDFNKNNGIKNKIK